MTRISTQQTKETVEVLKNGPLPEIKLGAVGVVGPTPGAVDDSGQSFDNAIDRGQADIARLAPIAGDATTRGRTELPANAETRKIREFMVMNQGGKNVNDATGGGRVNLHEGKIISSKHYDIRSLQNQGLKLREVTDAPTDEPLALD